MWSLRVDGMCGDEYITKLMHVYDDWILIAGKLKKITSNINEDLIVHNIIYTSILSQCHKLLQKVWLINVTLLEILNCRFNKIT